MEKYQLREDIDTVSIVAYPAGGKGTLSEALLSNVEGMQQFEVGSMVRDHIKRQTNLAKTLKEYSEAGKMVPDEVIVPHIQDGVRAMDASQPWLLDGFPRTPSQVAPYEELMEGLGRKDSIVYLDLGDRQVAEEIAIERMTKRGESALAKGQKPRTEDIDPTVRRKRLDEALALQDVVDALEAKGKVIRIDATKGIEDVRNETRQKVLIVSRGIIA